MFQYRADALVTRSSERNLVVLGRGWVMITASGFTSWLQIAPMKPCF